MADVIPQEALDNLLDMVCANTDPKHVRLGKNDITPDVNTVLADFTPADYSGYAPVLITPTLAPEVLVEGVARTQAIPLSFAHNGGPVGNNVFTYYITQETGGVSRLLWCSRFEDAPLSMTNASDEIDFSIELRETQEV